MRGWHAHDAWRGKRNLHVLYDDSARLTLVAVFRVEFFTSFSEMDMEYLRYLGLAVGVFFYAVPFVYVRSERATPRVFDEAGLCVQDLGCSSGPTKCADGVLTTPGGTQLPYVCYTTIRPQ